MANTPSAAMTAIQPNGGESWKLGKKHLIKWDKASAGNYVKIQLLKSGKPYRTIKAKAKNDGKYRWKIPSSVKSGSEYQIKITYDKEDHL